MLAIWALSGIMRMESTAKLLFVSVTATFYLNAIKIFPL
jgi:hypothetical protein